MRRLALLLPFLVLAGCSTTATMAVPYWNVAYVIKGPAKSRAADPTINWYFPKQLNWSSVSLEEDLANPAAVCEVTMKTSPFYSASARKLVTLWAVVTATEVEASGTKVTVEVLRKNAFLGFFDLRDHGLERQMLKRICDNVMTVKLPEFRRKTP